MCGVWWSHQAWTDRHTSCSSSPHRLSPGREKGEGQRPRGGPAGCAGSPPCAVATAFWEPHGPTHLQGDTRAQLTTHCDLEKGPQRSPAYWPPPGPQPCSLPAADRSPETHALHVPSATPTPGTSVPFALSVSALSSRRHLASHKLMAGSSLGPELPELLAFSGSSWCFPWLGQLRGSLPAPPPQPPEQVLGTPPPTHALGVEVGWGRGLGPVRV